MIADIAVVLARILRKCCTVCCLALPVIAPALGGDAAWTGITSSNFELFTSAGEKQGREAILYFERVQAVFTQILKGRDLTPLPVRIVLFSSRKDYAPYRPRESAAAYYMSSRDRDYIVMSGAGVEEYPVALHEYTHLLIRHGKQKVPLWFNEGLAELYSSLKPQGGRAMIGSLLPGRMTTLRREKWIPVPKLVTLEQDAPEYTDKQRAAVFYAESWAFAHMLVLQDNYRQELPRLMKALGEGKTPAEAFQTVYRLSLEQLDKVLKSYVYGDRFNAGFFNAQFGKTSQELTVTRLTSYESGIILSDLLTGLGKYEDAARMYESLARRQPNRAEAEQGLAYLALRKGDREMALRHFERAVSLDSNNPQLYRDYAGILEQSGVRDRELQMVLEKALSLDPGSVDTRMRLARHFLRNEQFSQALAHYQQIKQLNEEQADAYFEGLFVACYRTGEKTCARAAASQMRVRASTPSEILAAERRLKLIDRPIQTGYTVVEDEPPVQRRVTSGENVPKEQARTATLKDQGWGLAVTGQLEKLDCGTVPARVVVSIDGKPAEFVIDGNSGLQLDGFGADTVELECGPLKAAQVSITFRVDENTTPPTRVVRSIRVLRKP